MRKSESISRVLAAVGGETCPSSDFDLNPGFTPPPNRKLRQAAVLVPLFQTETGLRLILTKRASSLKHHPGQIAFPGGKQDETDTTLEETAIREAQEEIGLNRENITILGRLARHETVSNFVVTPIVAHITGRFSLVSDPGEVEEIFDVPFDHVTNPARFSVQHRYWLGQQRFYYTVPFGPYYIWGATARILHGFSERLNR
jgi:8-oxo-dGTP pyrophosphatase MutT (NUDIX family)